MIFTKVVLLTTLASAGRYAAAVPVPDEFSMEAQLQVVERGVEDAYSYDLERRQKGSLCMPLTKEDVKKLPGWAKLESIAKSKWGNGKYELVVNPSDYPDRPANVCGQSKPVVVKGGKPSCQSNKSSMAGKLTGTNGSVNLAVTTGTNYQITTSTTKAASIGTSMTSTFGLEVTGLAKMEQSFTLSATVTNTIGKQTASTQNNQQSSQITAESKDGKTCDLTFEVETCSVQGKGSFKYIADGFVWFNYHSKTKGHYKWSLSLSELNESDRSSTMEIETLVKAESKGKYNGSCVGGKAGAASKATKSGAKTPAKPAAGGKKTTTPAKQPAKANSAKKPTTPAKKPAATKPTKK